MKDLLIFLLATLLILSTVVGSMACSTTDTTLPIISTVLAIDITDTSTVICWFTDESSTSQVEYGTTTAYGTTSIFDKNLDRFHRVSLIGLEPATIYHYCVKSEDASGNDTISVDNTFTTTGTVAPTIPANYTTYTDEMNIFSISYPPDWELALSEIDFLEQFTDELLLSIESNLPVEQTCTVFFAGVPTVMGYTPSVNIICESPPGTGWTHDEVVEAEIQGIKYFVEDYHEFNRTNTTIDGRKSTIVDWEGTYPVFGKTHLLQMFTYIDTIVWVVTCTADLGEFGEYEDDFYHIVRSLRVLK